MSYLSYPSFHLRKRDPNDQRVKLRNRRVGVKVCLHHQLDDECNTMIDVCKTRKPLAICNEGWKSVPHCNCYQPMVHVLRPNLKAKSLTPPAKLGNVVKKSDLALNYETILAWKLRINRASAPNMKLLLRARPTCDTLDARYPPLLNWPQKIAVGIQSIVPWHPNQMWIKIPSRVKPCWGTNEVTI